MHGLREAGLDRNTVVVYASDQGFYLGEHGLYDKRWMYEESLRFPLVVRWPGGAAAGAEAGALVQNLDLAPTILEAARVPVPDRMQGRSLVPTLGGEAPADWRTAVYYRYYEDPGPHHVARHEGVRTDRYKLVRYYAERPEAWELFDLERDPSELRSVYGSPRYAAVQARLARTLDSLRAAADVPPDSLLDRLRTARVATRAREGGYTLELRVPWEAVRVRPAQGVRVGFDLHLTDADAPGPSRDAKLVWAGAPGDQAYQTPSAFGLLTLGGPASAAPGPPASASVPHVARPPTLDGERDAVWDRAVRLDLAHVRLADAAPDASDLSAEARALWDDGFLYLLLDVTDDALVADTDDRTHLDDNVEVYLDGDAERGRAYDADDLHLRVRPGRAEITNARG